MTNTKAPGLPGAWINAWLAAIGITILTPNTRLAWTSDPQPMAVFDHPDGDLYASIAEHLPSADQIESLAIATTHPDSDLPFPRNITVDAFADRVRIARDNGDPTLSSTATDLQPPSKAGQLAHSPFDPPAAQGKTFWDRLLACREAIPADDVPEQVQRSLSGTIRRVQLNGLGFDHRRFLSPTDPTGKVWIDPVVEVLAGVGLALLPSRGNGVRASHRGWTDRPLADGAFTWPTWSQPLGTAAIDALLDQYWASRPTSIALLAYETIAYQPRASMDQTRGYASRVI